MPIELSEVLGDERWVPVQLPGGVLQVAYRPGATSLKRQAQMQKQFRELQQLQQENPDEMSQVEQVGKVFCELISNWDLTVNGNPMPLTPESVADLPNMLYGAIMQAVKEDSESMQAEKKASSNLSGGGSPQAGNLANAQNGIQQSERRGTWA